MKKQDSHFRFGFNLILLFTISFLLAEQSHSQSIQEYQSNDSQALFECNLTVKGRNGIKTYIDERDKPVILGYGNTRYDLQPVFDGEVIVETFNSPLKFMASIFPSKDIPGEYSFMIGIYRMQIDFNTPGNEEYWRPSQGESNHGWVATPILEDETIYSDKSIAVIEEGQRIGGLIHVDDVTYSCRFIGHLKN